MPTPIWLILFFIWFDRIMIGKKDIDSLIMTNKTSDLPKTLSIRGFHSGTPKQVYHNRVDTTSMQIRNSINFKCFLLNMGLFKSILY